MSKFRIEPAPAAFSFGNVVFAAILLALSAVLSAALTAAVAYAQSIAGDAERGEAQFEATCAECHGPAATAPTLRGVIGRPIASVADFYGYSTALQEKKNLTWTKENLDAYMKSPDAFAPGNLMYREYPDAQMRADIVAFLELLPPPR
jgi:cytochrome c